MKKKHLEKVLSQIQLQLPVPLQKISTSQSLSGPARGKVRYISGYVVAKLKHTISTKLRNCLFVKKMESQIEQLQEQMILLNSLCISYDELIISGSDPESLDEIKRKQIECEGLTNITDNAFQFFTRLENLCRTKLTHFNLIEHGKKSV